MNNREINAILLIWLGVVVSAVLLIIDYKLKADTIKALGGAPIGARPDNQSSNWDSVRIDNNHLRTVPNSRFATGMETRSADEENSEYPASASELADGDDSQGIQGSDIEVGT